MLGAQPGVFVITQCFITHTATPLMCREAVSIQDAGKVLAAYVKAGNNTDVNIDYRT